MLVATRRLASFYKIISLSRYNLSVELKELLEAGVNRECSDSILENVITCLRLDVMWGVHALQQASAPDRVSVVCCWQQGRSLSVQYSLSKYIYVHVHVVVGFI